MYYNDLFYCEVAGQVYWDTESFKDYHVETINIDNCRARIYSKTTETIIAYCGTDDIRDVKHDLSATLWRENYGRIHRGFRDHAHRLYARVAQIAGNSTNVVLVGHSLGGGAATVTAYWLQQDFPNLPVTLYTYGSPRVGWNSFIKNIRTPHRRWVNNNDVVCRVPPWFLGYKHHGTQLYINRKGELSKPSITDRILGYRQSLIDPFTDHHIDNYYNQIKRLHENYVRGND